MSSKYYRHYIPLLVDGQYLYFQEDCLYKYNMVSGVKTVVCDETSISVSEGCIVKFAKDSSGIYFVTSIHHNESFNLYYIDNETNSLNLLRTKVAGFVDSDNDGTIYYDEYYNHKLYLCEYDTNRQIVISSTEVQVGQNIQVGQSMKCLEKKRKPYIYYDGDDSVFLYDNKTDEDTYICSFFD